MQNIEPDRLPEKAETPLAWHRPQLQRLGVSLDTSNQTGSFTDFEGGYSTVMIAG